MVNISIKKVEQYIYLPSINSSTWRWKGFLEQRAQVKKSDVCEDHLLIIIIQNDIIIFLSLFLMPEQIYLFPSLKY